MKISTPTGDLELFPADQRGSAQLALVGSTPEAGSVRIVVRLDRCKVLDLAASLLEVAQPKPGAAL